MDFGRTLSGMRFEGVPPALSDPKHRAQHLLLAGVLAALTVLGVAAAVMSTVL